MTSSISPPTRYLWAAGAVANSIPVGDRVDDRYQVIAPQLWQDTQPDIPPSSPEALPDSILPYARLYNRRLHIPEVYSVIIHPHGTQEAEILLLDNVPITVEGKVQPALTELWAYAPAVRQVYWLWQLLELWTPLSEQGAAVSLLNSDNLRVEGWRVRLLELLGFGIPDVDDAETKPSVTLAMLGAVWMEWCKTAREAIRASLTEICGLMQQPDTTLEDIKTRLNRLLLEQAAQLPLFVELAGLSDTGPQRDHNEDSCYPTLQDLQDDANNPLLPYLAIVCDGVGGHDGGEVASQQAVQTLKLLLQALLWDVSQQPDLQSPELIHRRLEACVRLVNNQIASQNDQQGREMRQRMGTTLVMALQLPQKLPNTEEGQPSNSHELYLCNVGDSRAYWITTRYCHQLTIDDDIAARDVRVGYSLRHEALRRSDSGILTQAVGTRNASSLRPCIQRFVVEEDGILLLCSDGLSDHDWVEQCWQDYAEPILTGELPLATAVHSLIDLANQRNGHDNTSVILMLCRIYPLQRDVQLFQPGKLEQQPEETSLSEASQALLDLDHGTSVDRPALPATSTPAKFRTLVILVGTIAFLLGFGITGLWTWSRLDPSGFQQWRDRVFPVNPQ